jgi:hypothetical protein
MKNTIKNLVGTVNTNVRNHLKFSSTIALSVVMLSCSDLEKSIDVSPETSTKSSARVAVVPSEVNINFQNYANGATYSKTNAEADLKSLTFWDESPGMKITQYDNTNGYRGLRFKMFQNSWGSAGGIISETNLAPRKEYTLEYKVYFEPGFEFNKGNSTDINAYGGGKLPGLTGGSRPSGCTPEADGFSARVMWRKELKRNSTTSANGGYLELYQYWKDQKTVDPGGCGGRFILQNCEAGQWYTIKIRVNLGSSTTNGFTKVWVNGVERHNKPYRFIDSKDWNIDGMMWHAFYGGNDSTWAPTQDRYFIIDNYKADDNAF